MKAGDIVKFIGHKDVPHVKPFIGEVREDSDETSIYLWKITTWKLKPKAEWSILAFNQDGTLVGYPEYGPLLVRLSGHKWKRKEKS